MSVDIENMKIPRHVAIILDGNGRWAKKRFMPRNFGHIAGARNVETICRAAYDAGIEYLTVYAFSTENWNRPADEVGSIMELMRSYLKDSIEKSRKNNMVVRVIGDRSRLDEDIKKMIEVLEEDSSRNTGLNFTIALNYGGRDEIIRAINRILSEPEGRIKEVDDETFSRYLDTAQIPDPDLLIRTSGEERLSNFLIWQLAYAEFYFTDVLWPDFDKKELLKAIVSFNKRDRRFGGINDVTK
ncbi:undecaprenyl diphosphate synthase [Parasporobacterium paucivorans DSM 15970]|uniref:Isoprenyl transferase n=2 Tax=Parasporobacterium TaxID=115543 RepID=A0A1M6AGG4_9FIRM|nr:undecaprenyl diphosphate synthase [Parasporobacterium paucivorans DSM 15970]